MRDLRDDERERLSRTPQAALALVRTGEIRCDRCDQPAQTVAVAEGETDAVCYACYPEFQRTRAVVTRAAVREMLGARGSA